MKRLLEWKQRMLQSPLTRKPNSRPDGTTTPQPRTNNEAYRQQVGGTGVLACCLFQLNHVEVSK